MKHADIHTHTLEEKDKVEICMQYFIFYILRVNTKKTLHITRN